MMPVRSHDQLQESVAQLKSALGFYEADLNQQAMWFLAVLKAFDVAVKCAWEKLSQRVEAEGVEVLSPKDAIRQAAKMKIIKSAEEWLDYINTRNSSVHDYFGISQKDFVELARHFLKEAEKTFGTSV